MTVITLTTAGYGEVHPLDAAVPAQHPAIVSFPSMVRVAPGGGWRRSRSALGSPAPARAQDCIRKSCNVC